MRRPKEVHDPRQMEFFDTKAPASPVPEPRISAQESVLPTFEVPSIPADLSPVFPELSNTPTIGFSYCRTPAELKQIIEEISKTEVTGLDTETVGRGGKLGHDILCWIQIYTDEQADLIDAQQLVDQILDFKTILEDPALIKACHFAQFERRMFEKFGIALKGVVDTWEIGKKLRPDLGSHSLQALMLEVLGFAMSKAEQKSRWDQPLTESQEKYAALDPYATILLYRHFKPLLDQLVLPVEWGTSELLAEIKRCRLQQAALRTTADPENQRAIRHCQGALEQALQKDDPKLLPYPGFVEDLKACREGLDNFLHLLSSPTNRLDELKLRRAFFEKRLKTLIETKAIQRLEELTGRAFSVSGKEKKLGDVVKQLSPNERRLLQQLDDYGYRGPLGSACVNLSRTGKLDQQIYRQLFPEESEQTLRLKTTQKRIIEGWTELGRQGDPKIFLAGITESKIEGGSVSVDIEEQAKKEFAERLETMPDSDLLSAALEQILATRAGLDTQQPNYAETIFKRSCAILVALALDAHIETVTLKRVLGIGNSLGHLEARIESCKERIEELTLKEFPQYTTKQISTPEGNVSLSRRKRSEINPFKLIAKDPELAFRVLRVEATKQQVLEVLQQIPDLVPKDIQAMLDQIFPSDGTLQARVLCRPKVSAFYKGLNAVNQEDEELEVGDSTGDKAA